MKSPIEEAARFLGIDAATLERMARDVDKLNPEFRKYFNEKFADKGFDESVSEFEEQLKEVLKHVRSPNVGGNRGRG